MATIHLDSDWNPHSGFAPRSGSRKTEKGWVTIEGRHILMGGDHVALVTDSGKDGPQHIDLGGPNNEHFVVSGNETPFEVKNAILTEIDANVNAIPSQVRTVDHVFFGQKITAVYGEGSQVLDGTVGVTLVSGPGVRMGFNSAEIAKFVPGSPNNQKSVPSHAKTQLEYAKLAADHEMGHVLQQSLDAKGAAGWEAVGDHLSYSTLHAFSTYGASSSEEAFAESYAAYVNKMPMPKVLKTYMASVVGQHFVKSAKKADGDEPIGYACGFGNGPTYRIYRDRIEQVSDDGGDE